MSPAWLANACSGFYLGERKTDYRCRPQPLSWSYSESHVRLSSLGYEQATLPLALAKYGFDTGRELDTSPCGRNRGGEVWLNSSAHR